MLAARQDREHQAMTTYPVVRFLAALADWIKARAAGQGWPVCGLAAAYLLAACTPTVKVEVPKEPITINLNVKIEHEIRVKVEKELEDLFTKESGLF
jgi:hypothetical protein